MPSSIVTGGGAELTAEDVRALLVEPLLAQSVVLRAGPVIFDAQGVPVKVPLIDSWDLADPWRGEGAEIGESDPAFRELTLLPSTLKSLKIIHRVSNELVRHGVVGVTTALATALVTRVGLTLDKAFLVGTGAGSTIVGLASATGTQSMPAVGVPTVDDLHDALGLALGANAQPNAWFAHPRDLTTLRKAKASGSGEYLVQPDPTVAGGYTLLGIPVYTSTQIPTNGGAGTNESTILLADMRQVAVGRDVNPTVAFLTERYADYDQTAIRVVARYDIGLLNPEGVVKLTGVTAA